MSNNIEGKRARIKVGTPIRNLITGKPLVDDCVTSVEYVGPVERVRNPVSPGLRWFVVGGSPAVLVEDLTIEAEPGASVQPAGPTIPRSFEAWWEETGQHLPLNPLDTARDAWEAATAAAKAELDNLRAQNQLGPHPA